MQLKERFKMYKVGKKWCCAAIVLGSLILGVNTVKADVINNAELTIEVQKNDSASITLNQSNGDDCNVNINTSKEAVTPLAQSNTVATIGKSNTFSTVNNSVYHYGNDGNLVKNQWYQNWGHKYYFGSYGARYTNKVANIDNNIYYFDNEGIMKTDTFQDRNGKTYYFGNDGREYQNQFYNNWGQTYYFGSDGARWDNRFYSNWGRTYYFGLDGARWDNRFYSNWGHTYYFGSDGARWDNQFYNNWGRTYYFGSDGARWDNRFMDAWGHKYYFGNDGALQKQNFTIGHQNFFVDSNNGIINGTLLNAPYINQYQVGDMACEATALLEALHNKGYAQNYNIQSFIKTMPIAANGNPNDGFGGGYQHVTYGIFQSIYPAPLAKWGSQFGNVQNVSGVNPAFLQNQLINGNPVVVYVTMHWAAPQYGRYWWGTGVNNSHVMTLDGYRPGEYHVEDPAGGSYWVTAKNFENSYNIKKFAVVIK